MAIWNSNGAQTGGSGSYVSGTQSVNYILATFAHTGDTITLPAGTFSWSGTTTINIAITLQGVDPGQSGKTAPKSAYPTVINNNLDFTGNMLQCKSPNNGHIEIKWIAFNQIANNGQHSAYCIQLDRSDCINDGTASAQLVATPYTCLLHDCYLDAGSINNYMANCSANGIIIWKCTLAGNSGFQMVCGKYYYTASWNTADTYGTQDTTGVGNTYIEDCNIIPNASGASQYSCNADDNSRVVFRNSTFQDCAFGSHGQESSPFGMRSFEMYNNVMNCSANNPQNMQSYFTDRGGAGVFWGNTLQSIPFKTTFFQFLCLGTNGISNGQPTQTSYPAARQCGQGWSSSSSNTYGHPQVVPDGTGQVTAGTYMWNNTGWPSGVVAEYSAGGTNYTVLNRDYFLSAKPGYTPYAHPHPLTLPSGGFVYPTLIGASLSSSIININLNPHRPKTTTSSLSLSLINVRLISTGGSGSPALVNHVSTGMGNTPVNTFTVHFPDPVLSGNCLVCFVQCSTTSNMGAISITSVKDNLGNSFALATNYTNSSFSKQAACYVLAGATAGVTSVIVTFLNASGNVFGGFGQGYPQVDVSQWYNIASSSPVDAVATSNSSKSLSLTTVTDGDLILYWAIDLSDNGSFNGTSITAGSGFTLLTADRQVGSVLQYQIKATHGLVSPAPTCTTSGSATWGSLAVALKSASSGTAPSSTAIRIVNEYHCSFSGQNNGNPIYSPVINTIQFPCVGNLLVASYQAQGAISSAIDTNSAAFQVAASITSAGNQTSEVIYLVNNNPNPNYGINFTFNSGTLYPLGVIYDLVNGAASPFDIGTTGQGNNTSYNSATLSITPRTANGVVFSMLCVSWDSVNSVGLLGAILDCIVDDLETNNNGTLGTQASTLDEDAGISHYYNSSVSPITFAYGANTTGEAGGGVTGPGNWSAAAAAFKSAAQPSIAYPGCMSTAVGSDAFSIKRVIRALTGWR